MSKLTSVAALASSALLAWMPPAAAEYPDRPVEVTVTFAAGGTPDTLARALAEGLAAELGQPFVIANRLGAGGVVGGTFVSRAKPDGYSLLFAPVLTFTVLPIIQSNVSYTPESFTPICQTFESQMALIVRPDSPYRSMRDIVDAAKAKPGAISYGHAGVGSSPHLAMVELGDLTDAQFNAVPYKGDAEVIGPLLGGHIDFAPITLASVPAGSVRIIGLFAPERNPGIPDVPTVKEQGFDVSPVSFGGLLAPSGLPAEIRATLENACKRAAEAPSYQGTADRARVPPSRFLSSAAFAERIAKDVADKKRLLGRLNVK